MSWLMLPFFENGPTMMDEIHQEGAPQATCATGGMKTARREVLSLFEAYCTMSRAASAGKKQRGAVGTGREERGISISGDRIQPEQGSTAVSLVRDALTGCAGSQGRDLLAEGSNEALFASCRLQSERAWDTHRCPDK